MDSHAGIGLVNRPSAEPIRAGLEVEETLTRMGVPWAAANLRIRREWKDLVSGQWRDKARPLVLEEGCLVVEVPSRMDAALLRYGIAGLTDQINTALGSRVVMTVKIITPRS